MGSFLLVHRRVIVQRAIILLLILALATFLIADAAFFELLILALLLIFIASQIFWLGRLVDVEERLIPGRPRRLWLAIMTMVLYLFVFVYSYPEWGLGHTIRAADYRPQSMFIYAAFWWWFVGSLLAFLLVIAFGAADRVVRAAGRVYHNVRTPTHHSTASDAEVPLLSSSRRRFLEQAAVLVSCTPFLAAGYGLFYERQNVEVVRQRVRLARLPKAFEGFHIAQLSDIHIGPFATADYIRRCVAITNELEPDLIVLTGDYICWDLEAQGEAVRVLAGLRAPYGVFGCLGNHEEEGEIEDSITALFTMQGIRILRQARAAIRLTGETLNLIGIDEPRGKNAAEWERDLHRRLDQVRALAMPETVNILLSHSPYPRLFDRAAELGIDLTLAGHTHGGQLSLYFLSQGLNLSRLIYRYNRGSYTKNGAQLYVNRGIGITGFPIRLGARPEITLLELART